MDLSRKGDTELISPSLKKQVYHVLYSPRVLALSSNVSVYPEVITETKKV